jgi:ribonuclease E
VVEPHGIPQGASSALAQIAASTLGHNHEHESDDPNTRVEGDIELNSDELDLSDAHDTVDIFDENDVVEILDIPVRVRGRKSRRATVDTSEMLDSVLDALPDPKSPGEGKSRGR